MKNIMIMLALMSLVTTIYAQSPAEKTIQARAKVEAAHAAVQIAEKELETAEAAMIKDARVQIKANDALIASLRSHMVCPRYSSVNVDSRHQVDALEDRNVELRSRLYEP